MKRELNNISLKPYNSFDIDATAACIIEYDTTQSLSEIFADPAFEGSRWAVLGGGNNIIFSSDYNGVLLHPVSQGITITANSATTVKVRAEAGVEWDDYVAWCVDKDLWGAENLSLIPGYVGAAPVQNIGAYGVEAKDIIESVEMYCVDSASILTLSAEHCNFGYRESIFKNTLRGKVIITAVNFCMSTEPCPNMGYGDLHNKVESMGATSLRNIREAVIEIRQSKLPDPKVMGNAGSFFKNPTVSSEVAAQLTKQYPSMPQYPAGDNRVKLAAGWLIDTAGWKGHTRERVGVHQRQALVLVNRGGATGDDILSLARDIQADILNKFGIEIQMEVNVL